MNSVLPRTLLPIRKLINGGNLINGDRVRRICWLIATAALFFGTATSQAEAQGTRLQQRLASGLKPDPDVPKSALLTDRGRQLADRLSQLKRSYAAMGPRHPSKQSIEEEIALVKEQLKAWSASPDGVNANQDRSDSLAQTLPEMNDTDLRQLVLRLVVKVEMLEKRILDLETRVDRRGLGR